MTGILILLRHGVSAWNQQGLFTGWVDVPLAPSGILQARRAARMLADAGLVPEVAHTSLLVRASRTAEIVLEETGASASILVSSWRLNERHYGALQGRNKREIVAEFGEEQYSLWRRSFDTAPPALLDDSPDFATDSRYTDLGDGGPASESLRQVLDRVLVHWHRGILPSLEAGKVVLVVSHSNTLRALIKHLDRIDDLDIVQINVPTGIPLIYRFDHGPFPTERGIYLDQQAALEGAAAVANEGKVPSRTILP